MSKLVVVFDEKNSFAIKIFWLTFLDRKRRDIFADTRNLSHTTTIPNLIASIRIANVLRKQHSCKQLGHRQFAHEKRGGRDLSSRFNECMSHNFCRCCDLNK